MLIIKYLNANKEEFTDVPYSICSLAISRLFHVLECKLSFKGSNHEVSWNITEDTNGYCIVMTKK